MRHFIPTFGIKDTAKNCREFVMDEHIDVFWRIFKPLAIWIVIFTAVDIAVSQFLMPIDPETEKRSEFGVGNLLVAYLYSCLVISWHRVVIHGPNDFQPMNPLKPEKTDWVFIGMGILLGIGVGIVIGIISAVGIALFKALGVLIILPAIFASLFVLVRLIFYFPSKATKNTITLKQSFEMTKGYVWKLIAAPFLANLKLFILFFIYVTVGLVIIGIIVSTLSTPAIIAIVSLLFTLPIILYFQPLMTVIGVTVLSNYYQHALQNKGVPE